MNKLILSAALLLISVQAHCIPITANSWVVADQTGKVIQQQNADQMHSIASISKLMTVMIVLDEKQDLDEHINKNFTRRQLIQMALVRSNNPAAELLCNNYPGGRYSCIKAMNEKAQRLGLVDTHFIEPTGLSIMNVSTANELVPIVVEAQKYPEVSQAAATNQFKIRVAMQRHRKIHYRTLVFHNTNHDAGNGKYIVSKTGYIKASGGCIVMMLDTEIGRRIVVLLGSHNTHTRVPEAEYLASNSQVY